MNRAGTGNTVTISYIGTLDNGRIFQNSDEHGPLSFTIGADQVFPALEEAIIGMKAGEAKNVVLTAAEAYGPRLQENIVRVSRSAFPAEKEIVLGQKLSIEFKGGRARVMRVIEIGEEDVTLDGNHPLAGMELTFALKVERIG